jgi:hypothetical protein
MTPKEQRQFFVQNQHRTLGGTPKEPTMNREDILKAATQAVCMDREITHGKADKTFGSIARLWEVTFGVPIQEYQVAIAMTQLKQVRIIHGDHTEADHWIDCAGYSALGGEIAGKE